MASGSRKSFFASISGATARRFDCCSTRFQFVSPSYGTKRQPLGCREIAVYRYESGMQTEQSKELVRRWIAFADAGFPGTFDEFIATDYVGHLGDTDLDVAELERAERAFTHSFPDTLYSIEEMVAENDRVVLRVTTRGTHRGEFQGIAPTGRRVEFTGIVIYRIAGNKIAESWGELDFLRLMRQLR